MVFWRENCPKIALGCLTIPSLFLSVCEANGLTMESFVVPIVDPQDNPRPVRRPRWQRSTLELDGRISSRYRHDACQMLFDSYAEVRSFGNIYTGHPDCPTNATRGIIASRQNRPNPFIREGIMGLEFDSKGVYLALVTKSGCLTVLDFESLYCSTYGPYSGLFEDQTYSVMHICTSLPLDVVRWNLANQDEVCCASRQRSTICIYDIGYVSSDPIEVLEKGKPKFSLPESEHYNGLSDVAFASADKSRLMASGLDGCIYTWDRRVSTLSCVRLKSCSQSPLNSIQLDVDDRIVFGANKQGIIFAWDLRGGRASFAFQPHNEVPLLMSLKVSSMLEKITSLKAQSNISPKEIHSIDLDPSCFYQLAFHLDDGWSGVLNLHNLNVTHMHCPPPWLDGLDAPIGPSYLRRPAWLPTIPLYAVGSSSGNGIYLLDFFPDTSSPCHVDHSDALNTVSDENKRIEARQNRYIPVSEGLLVCAVHPQNGTIIAGSKQSTLLMISQRRQTDKDIPIE